MKTIHLYLSGGGIGDAAMALLTACGLADAGHGPITLHTRYADWFGNLGFYDNLPNLTEVKIVNHPNYPAPPVVDDSAPCIDVFNYTEERNYYTATNALEKRSRPGMKWIIPSRAHWYMHTACTQLGIPMAAPTLPLIITQVENTIPTRTKKYVVLSPFAAQAGRTWPLHYWYRVLKHLNNCGYSCVIAVQTPEEKKTIEKIFNGIDGRVICKKSPKEMVGLIANAKLLLANDSGMAHIAALNRVPAVVVMAQAPSWWVYPFTKAIDYGRFIRVATNLMPCTGCYWQSEHHGPECKGGCIALQTTTPGNVISAIQTFQFKDL